MIRLEGIEHDYGRGAVVTGIDHVFSTGRVTAICGPNAAGKTTLLRIAAGLLAPSRGTVRLGDRDLRGLQAGARARRIAFMSQRFDCASGFPVRRILELARVMVGRDAAAISMVVDALGLEPLLDRGIAELSVGQCQRVALARTLAQCPGDGVIVLDEPLAALDPRWAHEASRLLQRRARGGATVLLSVHELAMAARLAEEVLLVGDRRLVASGPTDEVLSVERLEAAYGIPFERLVSGDGTLIPIPGTHSDPSERV